jgi:hypothetical protein
MTTRLAKAETLERKNPERRHRSYPRTKKRATYNGYPIRAQDYKQAIFASPPVPEVFRLQTGLT